MMAVSDNGIGMDLETQRHIFEPFFTTKSAEQGTGLGLSTVYGIVKQNHGDIWVYSEPGKGTTMKIYLPRVTGEVAETVKAEGATAALQGGETVLVVEDEPGVQQLIAKILRDYGYTVLQAANGREAGRLFDQHKGHVDLVITDVVMPHGNGRELAEQLASSQPDLKVLYISGYTENTIIQHGVLEENVAFLAKPFSFDALLTKVRDLLDKG
jgi:CheY-like chemotaxis protein